MCVKIFPDLSTISAILGLLSVHSILLLPGSKRENLTVLEITMCISKKERVKATVMVFVFSPVCCRDLLAFAFHSLFNVLLKSPRNSDLDMFEL